MDMQFLLLYEIVAFDKFAYIKYWSQNINY